MAKPNKTYTDAEVWADPRSAEVIKAINMMMRKPYGLRPLVHGNPEDAPAVRERLEQHDADARWAQRMRRRRAST
jgi:hypothetical protein